jgi:two-component system sensor histidine kinase KdpD
VVGATLLFVPFRFYVGFGHLAWLYICVVGLVAWLLGTGPALLAAALSFAAGTFFTPPIGAFWVSKPLDFIQLLVFFVGAAGVGALTGQVKKRESAAIENEREATALARLASEMAQEEDLDSIVDSAISCLAAEPDVRSVIVWTPEEDVLVPRGPGASLVGARDESVANRAFDRVAAVNLRESARRADRLGSGWPVAAPEEAPEDSGTFIPMVSHARNEGVLEVVGGSDGLTERTTSLAVSISHLLAIFISHKRAVEVAARIQGAQEAARVKSAIVSAVSHELKTPLAAAIAGVTDLESEDVARDPEDTRMMLHRVTENLERLRTAIADLLDLSRLQAEEWMPQPELYEAGEILGDVVEAAPAELRERLIFRVQQRPVPEVYADFAQVSRALRAVLDNAVAYSPAGPIVLGAERHSDRTVVWIEDRGPGVSDDEKPFVFDRAYRGRAGVTRPGGTGLGLTIARDLIEANAGRLHVEDAVPNGTRILVDLPSSAGTGDDDG